MADKVFIGVLVLFFVGLLANSVRSGDWLGLIIFGFLAGCIITKREHDKRK